MVNDTWKCPVRSPGSWFGVDRSGPGNSALTGQRLSVSLHTRIIHVELRSCKPCFVVLICEYQDACFRGRTGNSHHPHLPAGICYHGFTAGRGVDPAGNAPGGG
ncbi:hypothetical protein F511_03888 [Dorcoceras hygrometricum]|uniref:Uncharacterized protein n=1 Tax=Dorcoceras hygrometricum TaxID=472368 RepID=A0A2Z7AVZ4_9LAMI|nr:hypothetical protein F511_03888 [Dorcoceras hygrometricum]